MIKSVDLTGKKALITGGSRGIGAGIAVCLAKQGADVAINYRSNQEEASQVVDQIKKIDRKAVPASRQAFVVQADVSSVDEVIRMFAQVKKNLGGLDILVNNAGICHFSALETMTEEEWDKTLDVNLKGQFLCAREAIKLMKQKGGKIINISSVASGQIGFGAPQIAHYVASKGGVAALTEALAVELAPYKINVNAIAPGFIATDMTAGMIVNEQAKKAYLTQIPLKRFGKPEDIGATAAFLASDEANYLTGAFIVVDGGWLAG